jgi:hypothetical protein
MTTLYEIEIFNEDDTGQKMLDFYPLDDALNIVALMGREAVLYEVEQSWGIVCYPQDQEAHSFPQCTLTGVSHWFDRNGKYWSTMPRGGAWETYFLPSIYGRSAMAETGRLRHS